MRTFIAILTGAFLATLIQRGYAETSIRWVPVELKITCIKDKGRLCTEEESTIELGLRSDGTLAGWRPRGSR